MKNKSEAAQFLIDFYQMVETQFEKRIKRIRTVNGSEFQSRCMLEFYRKKGILLETSFAYSPQQNGVMERRNRTLVEMVRCNLKTMKMPDVLWGEAVSQSVYVLKRAHTKALKNSPIRNVDWKEATR